MTRGKRTRSREFWEVFTIAIFNNQATLRYSGGIRNSNITAGELLETTTAAKTAVSVSYAPGERAAYAVSLVNGEDTPVTYTVTDDLGGYNFGGGTVWPLAYAAGSARLFVNGAPAAAPAVTAGPPMAVTGITVPAGGSAVLVYEAEVTAFAPLGTGAVITNTAEITGGPIPVTAQAVLPLEEAPELTISKSVSPAAVAPGDTVTYTFVIQNSGTEDASAAEDITVEDVFDPVLTGITVTLDGTALTAPADYTYDEAAGQFATVPGRITVPGASCAQGADGTWSVTPGTAVLTVSGTI